jgi:hypothetical protein
MSGTPFSTLFAMVSLTTYRNADSRREEVPLYPGCPLGKYRLQAAMVLDQSGGLVRATSDHASRLPERPTNGLNRADKLCTV